MDRHRPAIGQAKVTTSRGLLVDASRELMANVSLTSGISA
jgi:hypothetical protein